MKYYVMTKKMKNGKPYPVLETVRTDKEAADKDVRIFKDICNRHAWVEESE